MLFRMQIMFWLYVSAVVTALFIADPTIQLLTGIVALIGASRLFRTIWRAAESNGANVALKHVWTAVVSDPEEHQSG